MSRYAGATWIEKTFNVPMSDFGRQVADILGLASRGIYHMDAKQLKKADWLSDDYITVLWYGEVATYDGDELTSLFLAAFDRGIRLSINAKAPRYLEIGFHAHKSTSLCGTHPTLETAIARHRELSPAPSQPLDGDR